MGKYEIWETLIERSEVNLLNQIHNVVIKRHNKVWYEFTFLYVELLISVHQLFQWCSTASLMKIIKGLGLFMH